MSDQTTDKEPSANGYTSASAPPPVPVLPEDVQTAPSDAPPSYEEVMGFNQSSVARGLAETPPLAYIDIMPRILTPGDIRNKVPPTFQNFSDIMEGANYWLASNPGLESWKCETVERRVKAGPTVDLESMTSHDSAYGYSVYVIGLRIWLTRKQVDGPVKKLGLLNIVPREKEIELQSYYCNRGISRTTRTDVITTFEGLAETVVHLNETLTKSPLPGSILNVETTKLRSSGFSASLNPENASFAEERSNSFTLRRHCHIIRVFYVQGEPQHEQINMQRIVPEITKPAQGMRPSVFEPFSNVLAKAQIWLQSQSGVKVVNIETRDVRVHDNTLLGGAHGTQIDYNSTDELVDVYGSNRFVRILRIFTVTCPSAPTYSSTLLTSRLFPPLRTGVKNFENMSRTIARVIAWLLVTRMPVFGVETVRFPFVDNDHVGFNLDRSDYSNPRTSGQLWVTAIRLYFPVWFQEPPPHLLPVALDWLTQGEGRNAGMCAIA